MATAPTLKSLVPKTLFGWTFFDPANLVCVAALATSAGLTVYAMRSRGAPDWFMPLGLYTCLALFLRGYFFTYYHGSLLGRLWVHGVLLLSLLASAFLWQDQSHAHQLLRATGVERVPASAPFKYAAALHVLCAITLGIHIFMPRRWLLKVTDELADRSGRDTAADAPVETIDDPEARAAREAAKRD